MQFADAGLVLGLILLVLFGYGALRRGAPAGRPVLLAGAAAAALFTGHTAVVIAVQDGAGPAELDGPVLEWFLAHRTEPVTAVMRAVSFVGDSAVTTAAILVVALVLAWRRRPAAAAVAALAILGAPLVGSVFKDLYGRARPPAGDRLTAVIDLALPSGHALNSVVVAGVLVVACLPHARRLPTRLVLAGVAAAGVLAVGVSRLYLGAHWFTDVLAGWLLGGAWLALCAVVVGSSGLRAARPAGRPLALASGS